MSDLPPREKRVLEILRERSRGYYFNSEEAMIWVGFKHRTKKLSLRQCLHRLTEDGYLYKLERPRKGVPHGRPIFLWRLMDDGIQGAPPRGSVR